MFNDKLNGTAFPEMLDDFLTAERNPYTGQRGIMDRTDRPHYNKFCEGIIQCLKPANLLEQLLAFSIAADYWRLNRTRNIEDGIFASSHPNPTSEFGAMPIDKQIAASQTSAFLCRQSDFKFLSTYEMRIQRTLNRHKTELNKLQTERRRLEDQPGPDRNGFAFSEPPAREPGATPAENVPAELTNDEPTKVRTAVNQSEPATPTNTETQDATNGDGFVFSNLPEAPRASENPPANGFAFSKPSAHTNGTHQNGQKDPGSEA